jgi:hypothetical protein
VFELFESIAKSPFAPLAAELELLPLARQVLYQHYTELHARSTARCCSHYVHFSSAETQCKQLSIDNAHTVLFHSEIVLAD